MTVNGVHGSLCTKTVPAPPAPAPAPKPAATRVRRSAPPAPRPAVQSLTADDIRRAVTEGVRAAMPVAPATTPAPVAPTASMSSGLAQQVIDRLVAVEDGQRKLTGRVNEVSDHLTTAEGRLVDLQENQQTDRDTLALVGGAAITGSKANRCVVFLRLRAQKIITPQSQPPQGCK